MERATRDPLQAKSIDHGYDSLVAASRGPRVSSGRTLQRALAISEPGDRHEREADEVAGRVMRMEAPHIQRATPPSIQRKCTQCRGELGDARLIQRMCTACEEEEQQQQIKRQDAGDDAGATSTSAVDSRQEAVDAVRGGQSLPLEERAFFEPRFGADFSGVRIHTDSTADAAARSVSALAYTRGSDIVFRQGQYQPGTSSGRRLLAHELTHVLQQGTASQEGAASVQRAHVSVQRMGDPCQISSGFPLVQQMQASPAIQRLTEEQRQTNLQSAKYAGNPRLQMAFDNNPAIRFGESGSAVRLVQEGLVADGLPMPESTKPTGEMDGVFGQETFTNLKRFQVNHSLSVDGVVGRETLGELDQEELKRGGSDHACSCPAGMVPSSFTDDEQTAAFELGSKQDNLSGVEPVADSTKAKRCPTCRPTTHPTSQGCPSHYSQAERDASRASNGRFDEPGSVGPTVAQQALMWDFEPGQDATRPQHMTGAMKMMIDLGLATTAPSAKIAIMHGHTDCVDKESLNFKLRESRAHAVRALFKDVGVREENLGPFAPATQGPLPGDDSTAVGRARNRSVVIIVMEPPVPHNGTSPAPENPRKRPCNASADPGRKWSLQGLVSATAAGGVGAGLFVFELKNRESGCVYSCLFVGFGGGLGVGVSLSAPGTDKFTTPGSVVNPENFEGGASVFSASIGIGPAAVEHAFINLKTVKTDPVNIDFGGLEAGVGGEIGVIGLEGKLYVEQKGIRRAPDLL